MSPLFALLSSISYGAADFLGGLATRRSGRVFAVVVLSQLVGLAAVVTALVFIGGDFEPGDAAWASGAGISGSLGLVLLYRALAIGTMSVLAPISAVVGALVPVAWGLIAGEQPGVVALGALPVAVVAIGLVGGGPGVGTLKGPGLAEALGAGIGFGGFFILIAQSEAGELWTLTFIRVASISVLVLIAVSARMPLRPGAGVAGLVVAAGVLDMMANLLFVLAERRGLLTLVAIVVALYPAGTVLLARVVLNERISRVQLAGLGLAGAAVVMVAIG